jgi:hypothetical protein
VSQSRRSANPYCFVSRRYGGGGAKTPARRVGVYSVSGSSPARHDLTVPQRRSCLPVCNYAHHLVGLKEDVWFKDNESM